ncbi:MAG: hypothetical protein FD146_1718 [Anaerolineaceae bacterium]|nr:MAG: hypothetical protein FD146_1718 [Anaerolineaceae bacterium]
MAAWQYTLIVSDIFANVSLGGKPVVSKVWEQKGTDGKTDWERIQQAGKDGWEMVNSYPLATGNGSSIQVVWVFKRPLPTEEAK